DRTQRDRRTLLAHLHGDSAVRSERRSELHLHPDGAVHARGQRAAVDVDLDDAPRRWQRTNADEVLERPLVAARVHRGDIERAGTTLAERRPPVVIVRRERPRLTAERGGHLTDIED